MPLLNKISSENIRISKEITISTLCAVGKQDRFDIDSPQDPIVLRHNFPERFARKGWYNPGNEAMLNQRISNLRDGVSEGRGQSKFTLTLSRFW